MKAEQQTAQFLQQFGSLCKKKFRPPLFHCNSFAKSCNLWSLLLSLLACEEWDVPLSLLDELVFSTFCITRKKSTTTVKEILRVTMIRRANLSKISSSVLFWFLYDLLKKISRDQFIVISQIWNLHITFYLVSFQHDHICCHVNFIVD